MATEEVWKRRVAEWRASGRAAETFCEGRTFSRHSLYKWSGRLGPAVAEVSGARDGDSNSSGIAMARVVRREAQPSTRSEAAGSVVIEAGEARVVVPPGADAETVRTVLDALGVGRAR